MEPDINGQVIPGTPSSSVADPQPDFDIDPRSPSYGIPRTPLVAILKSRTDLMRSEADLAKILDPRSPTVGITRTPVSIEGFKKMTSNEPCDTPSCPKSKVAKPFDLQKLIDPRSPTVDFDRTPFQREKKVQKETVKQELVAEGVLLKDPRSPAQDFARTPLQMPALKTRVQKETVKQELVAEGVLLKDPRSPAQDFARTPLQMPALKKRELPEVTSVEEVVRHIDFQTSLNTTAVEEQVSLEESIKSPDVSSNSENLDESLKTLDTNAAVEQPDLVQNIDEKFSTPCAKGNVGEKEILPESDVEKTELKAHVKTTVEVRKTKSFIFNEDSQQQQKFSTPKNFAKLRFAQKFDSESPSRSPLSTLGGKNSPKLDKNNRTSLGLEPGMRKRIGWNALPRPTSANINQNKEN